MRGRRPCAQPSATGGAVASFALVELLAAEKKALHALTIEARNRTLKQVHKIKLARRTIARLEMKRRDVLKVKNQ